MKRKKLIIILISIIIIISLIVISFLLLNKNQLVLKKDTFVFEFGDQVPFISSYYLKNPEEIKDIDEYKLNIEDKNKFSIVDDKLLSKDAELLEVGSYKLSMKYKDKEIQFQIKVEDTKKPEFKTVTKADVLGKWSVFFFYPADFTFVCPTELEDLANKYEEFKEINCEIYSVSCDTHFVHKAWHDASKTIQKIQYPMLADPTGTLARAFDVMIEEDGLAERGSFIVNPEGKIVAYEVIAGNVGRNADELFRRVQASQFVAEHGDQVCPAKWKPGADTLKPSLDLVGLI